MEALRKMSALNVTARSPNRSVNVTAAARGGITVHIDSNSVDDDSAALAGEISAAVSGALGGMRRGEEEILHGVRLQFDENSAEYAILIGVNDKPPGVEVREFSKAGNVKMRMSTYDSVDVRLKPDCLNRLQVTQLEREVNDTLAALIDLYLQSSAEDTRNVVGNVR